MQYHKHVQLVNQPHPLIIMCTNSTIQSIHYFLCIGLHDLQYLYLFLGSLPHLLYHHSKHYAEVCFHSVERNSCMALHIANICKIIVFRSHTICLVKYGNIFVHIVEMPLLMKGCMKLLPV